MAYNMRGQVRQHTFADGSVETREYTLGGALKKTVSQLGLVTQYDTDFMGRTVVKRDFDKQGSLLSKVEYTYQGMLLKSVKQEKGPTIVYHYDGAGDASSSRSAINSVRCLMRMTRWDACKQKKNGLMISPLRLHNINITLLDKPSVSRV